VTPELLLFQWDQSTQMPMIDTADPETAMAGILDVALVC
jgi:hypothetical protein